VQLDVFALISPNDLAVTKLTATFTP